MPIHEIFYYTTVKDSNNATLCVINFVGKDVLLYDRITVLLHSLVPFIIQIFSITSLIVLLARKRSRIIEYENSTSFKNFLRKQFNKQKELYINPLIIILSILPQIILSSSLACTDLLSCKRYLLLITYFFSYLSQMLSFIFHVLPSTLYKKEFHQTIIYRKLTKRILKRRHH